MRTAFYDPMLIYIYGTESLDRTIGNLVWGGQYVPNEQVRKQMISLSIRLSDDMDPAKWPEFLRRVRSNMAVKLRGEEKAQKENLEMMRRVLHERGIVYEEDE
jgi:hypothetical protein